ncbi:hypothetical protein ACFQZS_03470 [Mucilaginibacter calamicampi]|uniref:Uncharacterized protein n=1 Tax=Mucilaginibacter calamicampi TaxID=1302352 RepID=A0ABW2YS07_9SPHI
MKAAAVNDEFVLDNEGIIGDGIGAFGVIDVDARGWLAGGEE